MKRKELHSQIEKMPEKVRILQSKKNRIPYEPWTQIKRTSRPLLPGLGVETRDSDRPVSGPSPAFFKRRMSPWIPVLVDPPIGFDKAFFDGLFVDLCPWESGGHKKHGEARPDSLREIDGRLHRFLGLARTADQKR